MLNKTLIFLLAIFAMTLTPVTHADDDSSPGMDEATEKEISEHYEKARAAFKKGDHETVLKELKYYYKRHPEYKDSFRYKYLSEKALKDGTTSEPKAVEKTSATIKLKPAPDPAKAPVKAVAPAPAKAAPAKPKK